MLIKLDNNISIPAHWYFLFFSSLLNIKNVSPLTAIEKAINKFMKFPQFIYSSKQHSQATWDAKVRHEVVEIIARATY